MADKPHILPTVALKSKKEQEKSSPHPVLGPVGGMRGGDSWCGAAPHKGHKNLLLVPIKPHGVISSRFTGGSDLS